MPKTGIVCTIGPASGTPALLKKMAEAGMDIARLNFSHSNHPEHLHRMRLVRLLNRRSKTNIKILQDLEGYRIRIGKIRGGAVIVKPGQKLELTNRPVAGTSKLLSFDFHDTLSSIKRRSEIFIDDGKIDLVVKSVGKHSIVTQVVTGGVIKERKGINITRFDFTERGLTAKDEADLRFGLDQNVDYVAQSFVRDAEDIRPVRDAIRRKGSFARIIAKIENRQGIDNIDEIIDASDGIMVARGDMGVSLPIYEIPVIQKIIIKKCNEKRKFVITATQMLESMTEQKRPTRAEVTDVANAIFDGTDFVMLSGETAAGKYPVETVRMMEDIINYTEKFVHTHTDKHSSMMR